MPRKTGLAQKKIRLENETQNNDSCIVVFILSSPAILNWLHACWLHGPQCRQSDGRCGVSKECLRVLHLRYFPECQCISLSLYVFLSFVIIFAPLPSLVRVQRCRARSGTSLPFKQQWTQGTVKSQATLPLLTVSGSIVEWYVCIHLVYFAAPDVVCFPTYVHQLCSDRFSMAFHGEM